MTSETAVTQESGHVGVRRSLSLALCLTLALLLLLLLQETLMIAVLRSGCKTGLIKGRERRDAAECACHGSAVAVAAKLLLLLLLLVLLLGSLDLGSRH